MYGLPLTVPGELFPQDSSSVSIFLQSLRSPVHHLVPTRTSHHGTPTAFIPRTLMRSKYVFIRRDARRGSLQRLYNGPFKVLESGTKTFRLEVNGRSEQVFMDRLKPVNIDSSSSPVVLGPRRRGRQRKTHHHTSPSTPRIVIRTRSGRTTRPPQRFISVLEGVV